MPRSLTPSAVALAASGWVALAATALPAASTPRVLAVWLFVLLCPGTAFVRLTSRRTGPLETAVTAVALSLAAGTLVSEAFSLAGAFTVPRATATLAAVTTAAALRPALRRFARDAEAA